MRRAATAMLACLALAACGGGGLRSFERGAGPDEFGVLPNDPLVIPEDLSALPPPTPGGTNLADPAPIEGAIAALGGSAGAVQAGGIPAGDAALVAHAGRYGVDPAIRAELAAADARFRNRRAGGGILGLFRGGDRYFSAYAAQALDAYAELVRFRNLGVQVPSAPPPG